MGQNLALPASTTGKIYDFMQKLQLIFENFLAKHMLKKKLMIE